MTEGQTARRTAGSADVASALLVLLVAIVVFVATRETRSGFGGESLHPRTLPRLLAAVMVAAGAAILVNALCGRATVAAAWPPPSSRRRLTIVAVAFAAFIAGLQPLGFPIASAALLAALGRLLGGHSVRTALAVGGATGLVLDIAFVRLLGVPLPTGPLP